MFVSLEYSDFCKEHLLVVYTQCEICLQKDNYTPAKSDTKLTTTDVRKAPIYWVPSRGDVCSCPLPVPLESSVFRINNSLWIFCFTYFYYTNRENTIIIINLEPLECSQWLAYESAWSLRRRVAHVAAPTPSKALPRHPKATLVLPPTVLHRHQITKGLFAMSQYTGRTQKINEN